MASSSSLALALLALLLAVASADKGWQYNDVQNKGEAVARTQSGSGMGGVLMGDYNSSNTASQGAKKLKAMFDDWAQSFGYNFSPAQTQAAFKNFKANMASVQQINSNPSIPFWASGNAFSHLSSSDFAAQYLMNLPSGSITDDRATATWTPGSRKLQQVGAAAEVNWVTAGKVTPVRNQGGCGSCWAFAATSAIESAYLMKVGGSASTLNLAEQQMVSCVTTSYGCSGGYSDRAMNYVASANQTTEVRYPYRATTGSCTQSIVSSSKSGQAVKLSGAAARVSPSNSEATLMTAVATTPTVVYFAVDNSFQNYAGGVYTASTCPTSINHAMVAVGYSTTTSAGRYWVIRNSWGSTWGERGYIRVQMKGNGAGPCGMYQYAYLPPSKFISTPLV